MHSSYASGLPDLADFLTPDPRFKPPEDELPSFLPVEVLPDASLAAAMSDGDAVASDARIEITLSNGLSLCVSGAFDPDAVSRLVRGLAS